MIKEHALLLRFHFQSIGEREDEEEKKLNVVGLARIQVSMIDFDSIGNRRYRLKLHTCSSVFSARTREKKEKSRTEIDREQEKKASRPLS